MAFMLVLISVSPKPRIESQKEECGQSWAWWHLLVISTLGELRQEDY